MPGLGFMLHVDPLAATAPFAQGIWIEPTWKSCGRGASCGGMWRDIAFTVEPALAALRVAAGCALQDHTIATRHIFRGVLGIVAGVSLILYALVARSQRARGRANHRDLLGIGLIGGGFIVLGLSWLSWQAELIPWLLGIAGVLLAIVGVLVILAARAGRSRRRL